MQIMSEHLSYVPVENDITPEIEASMAMQTMTNSLHELADAFDEQREADSSIFAALYGEDFSDTLHIGGYTEDDFEEYAIAIDRLANDHKLGVWSMLAVAPNHYLEALANNNPELSSDIIQTALEQPDDDEDDYLDKIALANKLIAPAYGPATQWRKDGEPRQDLPKYLREYVEQPHFPAAAISTVEVWRAGEDSGQQAYRVRSIEKDILRDCMGIPLSISKEYERSLMKRTLKRDENDEVIPANDPGAGIDAMKWRESLDAAAEAVQNMSTSELMLLREDLGIVNYDRYTSDQLETMSKLLNGDPATIRLFLESDSQMMFGDADGDHNGAMTNDPRLFGSKMPTIFSEVHNIVDLYKPLVSLARKTGIKPCVLAYSLHGLPGAMGIRDFPRRFELVTWPTAIGEKPNTKRKYEQYNVDEAVGLGDFLAFYMQPHSVTGDRTLLFLSCSQAVGHNGLPSLPEVVLSKTNLNDSVVARAPRTAVSVSAKNDTLRFYDTEQRMEVPSVDFRLRPGVVLESTRVSKTSNMGTLL